MELDIIQRPLFSLYGVLEPYTKFPRIKKKKNGQQKVRWIHAPCDPLKQIQTNILYQILYRFAAHPAAHAYVLQKNIRTNAQVHCKNPHVITLDIQEFFPSITQEMLSECLCYYKESFLQQRPNKTGSFMFCWDKLTMFVVERPAKYGFPSGITSEDLLLAACTLDNVLPQGAPTSGALSNIVMYGLDVLFEQLAVERKIAYTRYADDLTFSGHDLEDLKQFVFGYVFKKLNHKGFRVNKSKVHVLSGDRRFITGLNVKDEGVRPARKLRRYLRAVFAKARQEIQQCTSVEQLISTLQNWHWLNHPLGILSYVEYTETTQAAQVYVTKYLVPIIEHIQQFVPHFSRGFLSHLPPFHEVRNSLDHLHKQCQRFTRERTVTWRTRDELGSALLAITDEHWQGPAWIRRAILQQILEEAPEHVTILSGVGLKRMFKIAEPQDRFCLLKTFITAKGKNVLLQIQMRTIVDMYLTLPYDQRLELASTIVMCNSFSRLEKCPSPEYAVRYEFFRMRCLRLIFRNIAVGDLATFVTCTREDIRQIASEFFKQKTRDNEIEDPCKLLATGSEG